MNIRNVAVSLQGKGRVNNEDSYYADPSLGLLIVSDGMGGHKAGEVASAMTVELIAKKIGDALREYLQLAETTLDMPELNPEAIIKEAIDYANAQIYESSKENKDRRNMGATVTLAWIFNDTVYIGHVGDSRAYFFGDEVKLVTRDHSVVGELYRGGSITKEEAKNHPNKHMLLRALGVEERVKADIFAMKWQSADCLLLCSDGLYGAFDIESILDQIDVTKDKNEILDALVKMAVDYGSKDDITGVLAWQSSLDSENSQGGAL
ncbi:MAG: Stp1/IreP family PP2C-type Ser/Thr phosphatase [Bacillota bacterium]|jgi:serine/threonine protein phosphatase PrpC